MTTKLYLTQSVHTAARTRPNEPFIICGDRRSTNRYFRDRVARLAGALRRIGVAEGERVGIVALNSDRFMETYFGCFWAGAVANPVNIRWNPKEMALALDDCGASVLVVDDAFAPIVDALRGAAPSLQTVVHIGDGATPAGMLSHEELVAEGPAVADAHRSGDDVAFVLYTGGTTGRSKGVMLSHANMASASLGMLAAGCGTGEVYLHAPPLFHMAGVQVMLGHCLGGGSHVIIPAFDPAAILAAIEAHEVTDVMLVPTMLQMVLAHPDAQTRDLSSLRRIFYGAAPMTEALLRSAMAAIPNTGFVQGYGMTETALTVMLAPWYYTDEGLKTDKITSIGQALPTAEVVIRDEAGDEVPPGTVGEITVRSASVMAGYYGNDELTAETVRDGWLRSGDGAYMDEDGFIYLVDRMKDMIITGGENVYSSEVESVLASHPAVAMSAVIGLHDEQWGERVHAVVVPALGASTSEDELIAHCKQQIAAYKCPRTVELVDALPMSAAGKILKADLRAERR